jgi:hypothetical protein
MDPFLFEGFLSGCPYRRGGLRTPLDGIARKKEGNFNIGSFSEDTDYMDRGDSSSKKGTHHNQRGWERILPQLSGF